MVASAWLFSRAVSGYITERRFDAPNEILTDEQMAAAMGIMPTKPVQPQHTYESARKAFETGEEPDPDTEYSA